MAVTKEIGIDGIGAYLRGMQSEAKKLRLAHVPIPPSSGSASTITLSFTYSAPVQVAGTMEISDDVVFGIPPGRRVTTITGRDEEEQEIMFTISNINDDFPNGGNFIVQSLKQTITDVSS